MVQNKVARFLWPTVYTVFQKSSPYDFLDNNVKWNLIWMIFGKNVAEEICNETVWNKCQIYSLGVATLCIKIRFNFLPKQ